MTSNKFGWRSGELHASRIKVTNYKPFLITSTVTVSQLNVNGNDVDETRAFILDATMQNDITPNGVAAARLKLTTTGALIGGVGGAWANTLFVKLVEGTAAVATHATSGYTSPGEFHMNMAGTWTPITAAVITMNAEDNRTAGGPGGPFSYFLMREYTAGSYNCPILFNFFDAAQIGAANSGKLIQASADKAATHLIKCLSNGTTIYLMGTTNAPS